MNLIEDMLDIGRISTGKLTIEPEEVNLNAIVLEVSERLSGMVKTSGTKLNLRVPPIPIYGFWDRNRIDQVITNLLTNAIKYGRGRPINVDILQQGNEVSIIVSDEGIGIAKENQERIFQRFERAVSGNISGLGLGLYIVRQIIEAHEGTIVVESELNKGSTFKVQLPIRPSKIRSNEVAS